MTARLVRAVLTIGALAFLAACTIPRGAALQSEITSAANSDTPDYSVVDVTRESVPRIAHWPVTGWDGGYRWLRAGRGPKSSIIRSGDRVDLVIWDSQENSLLTAETEKVVNMSGLVVSSTGTIFVPYVDEVVVSGQTPDQARKDIQERLTAILPAAQVQLAVSQGVDNSVDLVSGVAKPGTYPLPNRDYRILSLISQGGGISESLRNPLVRLIRDGASYEVPASDLLSDPARNVILRGGDQVVVEADERFFTALGATGQEKLIYFDREHVTALEGLSMMGGINDSRANPKGILILREYPRSAVRSDGRGPEMQYVVFVIDMTSADGLFAARNFRINPDDTVLATESPVTAANTVINLIGRLFFFGNQIQDL
ncbi:MAG: polysaccharide biosynthesis/export family protein [Pseudooceanicola sp.]